MCSVVEGCVRSCQCSKKMVSRVAKDLRNLRSGESVMEPCLWTFRDENSVIHVLCLVYVDDFMLACSDSSFVNMSLTALIISMNGESES